MEKYYETDDALLSDVSDKFSSIASKVPVSPDIRLFLDENGITSENGNVIKKWIELNLVISGKEDSVSYIEIVYIAKDGNGFEKISPEGKRVAKLLKEHYKNLRTDLRRWGF